MDYQLRLTLFLTSVVFSAGSWAAPSFDCTKASTPVEKMICADESLGNLDGLLSKNYRALFGEQYGLDESGKSAVKSQQKSWLSQRNRCDNKECLIAAYTQRINELCSIPVVTGVHDCQVTDSIQNAAEPTVVNTPSVESPVATTSPEESTQAIAAATPVQPTQTKITPEAEKPALPGTVISPEAEHHDASVSGPEMPAANVVSTPVKVNSVPEDLIKLPNDLQTMEDIKIAKDYLDNLEKEVNKKISAVGSDELYRQLGEIELSLRGKWVEDPEFKELSEKGKVIGKEASRLLDKENDIRRQYDFQKYRELIVDAEIRVKDKLAKEAHAKKVAAYREKANLDEEEYFVPLFECSVKNSYWCFSSSHKIYAVIGKVSIRDGSNEIAAIYEEVGQGEVEDYYKDKSSVAAELFVGRNDSFSNAVTENYVSQQKIWVSGTGRMPHVFMDRERR